MTWKRGAGPEVGGDKKGDRMTTMTTPGMHLRMTMKRGLALAACAFAAGTALAQPQGQAQDYPNKPITVVVAFGPGGAAIW
jgi:long-subunit fatty acid transport protein